MSRGAGDSVMSMLLKISADPTGATAGSAEAKAAIQGLADQVIELQAQLQVANENIAELSQSGMRRLGSETGQAKASMALLGEETGIRMSRHLRTFIADLGPVGPALASAFSVLAVVGIAEMLVEKLPAAYDKLTEKITGWGKKAREEYDKLIESNMKAEEAVLHFQMRLSEAMGGGAEENLKLLEKRMVEVQKSVTLVSGELEKAKKVALPGLQTLLGDPANVEALQHQLHGLKTELSALGAEYTKLAQDSAIERVKETEETRKWYGHEIEKSFKFHEEQQKKALENLKFIQEVHRSITAEITGMYRSWAESAKKNEEELDKDLKTRNELLIGRIKAENEIRKQGTEEVMHATVKMEKELSKEIDEEAKLRVKSIVESSKVEIENEKKTLDEMLSIHRQHLQNLASLHQISQFRVNTETKRLLDEWYKSHVDILQRQLAAAAAAYGQESTQYAKLIHEKESLDRDYEKKHAQTKEAEIKANQIAVDSALGTMANLAGALKKHHDLEIGLIVARAAIKIAESIADSVRAFALGDFRGGALFALAAVDYGVVAAQQAGSAGGGGGYAGGGGASAGAATASPGVAPALAPGAQGGSQPLHVIVMGQTDMANFFARSLTNAVRYGGAQLYATHAADGTAL